MAITKVEATLGDNSTQLAEQKDDKYKGSLVAPEDSGNYSMSVSAFDDSGNVTIADGNMMSSLMVNVSLWHKPKTDWKSTDRFNIQDFNRIKNNLIYLSEMVNEQWRPLTIEDMGNNMTEYTSYWEVEKFNMIERNLDRINKAMLSANYGMAQTFFYNGPFIKWDELNRIESAIFEMNDILERQKAGLRKLPFRLGKYKEVRI